jgi:hypothetical protein
VPVNKNKLRVEKQEIWIRVDRGGATFAEERRGSTKMTSALLFPWLSIFCWKGGSYKRLWYGFFSEFMVFFAVISSIL